jgi:type IV pilus assembly protein PilW
VASGVENMQLLYGVDTDGDEIPNQYLTADQITDWSHVVNMRVALLTRSGGNSTSTGGKSSFRLLDPSNGLTLTVSGDGHIRKVFEETVSIRNRLP